MKRLLLTAVFAISTACVSQAIDKEEFLGEYGKNLQFDVRADPDGNLDGDTTASYEAGFGIATFESSEIGLWLGANEGDNDRIQFGLFFEENFYNVSSAVPFVGLAAGWSRGDEDNEMADEDGFLLRGEGGIKLFITENLAFAASLQWSWASDDIWEEENRAEQNNLEYVFGVRYFY